MRYEIEDLKTLFENWESAKKYGLKLHLLETGRAIAIAPIQKNMLTPIVGAEMLIGMEGSVLANHAGLMAMATLLDDQDVPLLPESQTGPFLIPTVPEEEWVLVDAAVCQPPTKLDGENLLTCTVTVRIKNLIGDVKAELDFIYKIMPLEKVKERNAKIAARYLEFKKSAN